MRWCNYQQGGFTLIEVLFAIVIMAFGILCLYRLQITSIQSVGYAKRLSEATNIAQDRIERLLSTDYDLLSSGSDTYNSYYVSWTVANNSPVTNCKTLTVRVQWNQWGKTRTLQFVRIIAKP